MQGIAKYRRGRSAYHHIPARSVLLSVWGEVRIVSGWESCFAPSANAHLRRKLRAEDGAPNFLKSLKIRALVPFHLKLSVQKMGPTSRSVARARALIRAGYRRVVWPSFLRDRSEVVLIVPHGPADVMLLAHLSHGLDN